LARRLRPHIGLRAALVFVIADDWHRHVRPDSDAEMLISVKGYHAPVIVRLGSSDREVFEQVFVEQQYGQSNRLLKPKVVVDCGANVGYASVYFLRHFPEARVIAVEPDPRNVEICRRNLAPYGDRVKIIQKALWSDVRSLSFVEHTRKRGAEWAVQVSARSRDVSGSVVEAIDVPTLIASVGVDEIDLLKIDIEKSEVEVFGAGPCSWLERVRNIAIELHDQHCQEVFYTSLESYTFERCQNGEITLCFGIRRSDGRGVKSSDQCQPSLGSI